MAKSRGIELKPSVLAKLMLLERFFTESYKKLATAQAEQGGKPAELAAAEAAAHPVQNASTPSTRGSSAPAATTTTPPPIGTAALAEIPDWLADPSLSDWVASDPQLAGDDLRPYFFFSRDKLGPLGSAMQRMSPVAQEILAMLFREGKAQLKLTFKRVADLSAGDSSSVFQALAERVRQEEDPGREDSALARILDWMAARRDQFGQGMTLLTDLAEKELPVSLPPRIAQLSASADEKAMAKRLLEKWARATTNDRLKAAAATVLKKL